MATILNPDPTTRADVRGFLDAGRALLAKARPIVDELVTSLTALESRSARENLTPAYRQTRRTALLHDAQDALRADLVAWQSRARAIATSRETLTSFDSIARAARFAPVGPTITAEERANFENPRDILARDAAHATSNKLVAGVMLDVLDELRRMRFRAEVSDAADAELLERAKEAAAAGDLASAKVISDEVRRRGPGCDAATKAAVLKMRHELIAAQPEAVEAGADFDAVADIEQEVSAILTAITRGDDEALRILTRTRQLRASREAGRDPIADAQAEIHGREIERAAAAGKKAASEVRRAQALPN